MHTPQEARLRTSLCTRKAKVAMAVAFGLVYPRIPVMQETTQISDAK